MQPLLDRGERDRAQSHGSEHTEGQLLQQLDIFVLGCVCVCVCDAAQSRSVVEQAVEWWSSGVVVVVELLWSS